MIFELLTGIFLHFSTPLTQINSDVKGVHTEITAPSPRPEDFQIPKPKPSDSPKGSKTPKSTSRPSAQPTQSSSINTPSILNALNGYRSKNGVGSLQIDSKLQEYAQSRADYLKSFGKLDKHAQHQEFMKDGGFEKLGFNAIAENQGYNYKGGATGLIEKFYAKSAGHNKNQLNSEYTHVGIGITGPFTNIVFGGKKR